MALINNPNSWNGGTAVFNSAPITETYLKLAAHREAKNQALDQYHQKQLERVDRDGVRDQDAEQFQQKVNDWNQHWQMNKDNIRKGDIKPQIESDRKLGELLGFVRESKARAQTDKDSIPVAMSLKNEMGTYPDQFQQDHDANNLPIGAPGSKRMDLNPYLMKPDRWDREKAMKQYDHIPVDKTTTFTPTDPNTGLRTPITEEKFNETGKQAIAAMAGSDFQNNRSFNNEVKSAVADPAAKQHLEQVYQEQMGKKPEQPEEYATAFILAQKGLGKVEGKPEVDKVWEDERKRKLKLADDIKMEGIKQSGRVALRIMTTNSQKELAKLKNDLKSKSKDQQDNALDVIEGNIKKESEKPENHRNIIREGKVVGSYNVAPVPPPLAKQFVIETEDANQNKVKVYPTHFGYNKDGTIKVIYTNGEKGDRMEINNKLSYEISQPEFKALLGKSLGLGTSTTSKADYDGNDNENDDDTDDEIVPTKPAAKSDWKSRAKKVK